MEFDLSHEIIISTYDTGERDFVSVGLEVFESKGCLSVKNWTGSSSIYHHMCEVRVQAGDF